MRAASLPERTVIYTVGHSNLDIERFLAALGVAGVQTVVDLRSMPYSKYSPQFNRETLQETLRLHGIGYRFAGETLGGRPTDPTCYRSGELPTEGADYLHEVDYEAVAQRPWFRKGLDRLIELSRDGVVAMMCSEEDPMHCHRHHLITQALLASVDVFDIRTNQPGDARIVAAEPLPKQLNLL